METVGDRVRQAREAQGVSRAALAKAIGAKGESYVSELELGRIKKGSRLHLVAKALGVELEWLESGRGPMSAASACPAEPINQVNYKVAEPGSQSAVAWSQYHRANSATRSAVDLLLLPPKQRADLLADFELVKHCIEQLELHCQKVMDSVKSA